MNHDSAPMDEIYRFVVHLPVIDADVCAVLARYGVRVVMRRAACQAGTGGRKGVTAEATVVPEVPGGSVDLFVGQLLTREAALLTSLGCGDGEGGALIELTGTGPEANLAFLRLQGLPGAEHMRVIERPGGLEDPHG